MSLLNLRIMFIAYKTNSMTGPTLFKNKLNQTPCKGLDRIILTLLRVTVCEYPSLVNRCTILGF